MQKLFFIIITVYILKNRKNFHTSRTKRDVDTISPVLNSYKGPTVAYSARFSRKSKYLCSVRNSMHTLSLVTRNSIHTLSWTTRNSIHTLSWTTRNSMHMLSWATRKSMHTLSWTTRNSMHTLSWTTRNQKKVSCLVIFVYGI